MSYFFFLFPLNHIYLHLFTMQRNAAGTSRDNRHHHLPMSSPSCVLGIRTLQDMRDKNRFNQYAYPPAPLTLTSPSFVMDQTFDFALFVNWTLATKRTCETHGHDLPLQENYETVLFSIKERVVVWTRSTKESWLFVPHDWHQGTKTHPWGHYLPTASFFFFTTSHSAASLFLSFHLFRAAGVNTAIGYRMRAKMQWQGGVA